MQLHGGSPWNNQGWGSEYSALNSILFSSTVISVRTAGFISQIIIMKFSNVNNYNLVIQSIVMQALATVFFSWGFESEITIQLYKYGKVARSSIRIYTATLIGCAISCLLLFASQIVPIWMVWSILSGVLKGCFTGLLLPVLRFFQLGKFAFCVSTVSAIFGVIVKYILIQLSLSAIFAWTFTEFLVSGATVAFVLIKLRCYTIFDRSLKLTFTLAFPYLVSLLAFWFLLQFDRFYATHFLEPRESASYAALMTISGAILGIIVEFMRNSDLQFLEIRNKPKKLKEIFTRNFIYLPSIILGLEFVLSNWVGLFLPSSYTLSLDKSPLVLTGVELWITGMTLGNIRKYYSKNLAKQGFPIFLASFFGTLFILLVTAVEKRSWYVYFYLTVSIGYLLGSALIATISISSILKRITSIQLIMAVFLQILILSVFAVSI